MSTPLQPFNLALLNPTPDRLARVPRITSTEIYDGSGTDYNPQGLFSQLLFGSVGTENRDYTFGYIKLNTTVMHPVIRMYIKRLKRFYESIWKGEAFAIWDEKSGEFLPAEMDEAGADTGYYFFTSHIHELQFKKNSSSRRNQMIDVFDKYRNTLMISNHLVLPAGLRDIQTDASGKTTEDESNDSYRKLLRLANSLENNRLQGAELNNIRVSMQNIVSDIYEYFTSMLDGKSGFLQSKFASRNIFLGTRNVISSMDMGADVLGDPRAPTIDTVMIGLFQLLKSSIPHVIYQLRQSQFFNTAFPSRDGEAYLVHPRSLKRVSVRLEDLAIDRWTTIEGNEATIEAFGKDSFKTRPIMIQGHYLGLIYRDERKFMLLNDIDDLPKGWEKTKVKPITYFEFFYHITADILNKKKVEMTRYPVTGDGSSYIGDVYTKTTIPSQALVEYENGEPTENVFLEMPVLDGAIFQTMSPHGSRLPELGADSTLPSGSA